MIKAPTYEDFKRVNDESKSYFEALARVSNVDLKNETCTLTYLDRVTPDMNISYVVTDVYLNGMGALSNPSALKGWKGFSK